MFDSILNTLCLQYNFHNTFKMIYLLLFWCVTKLLWQKINLDQLHSSQFNKIATFLPPRKSAFVECVRNIWMQAHKICKAWVLINQILPRCFCSYGLWLNKSNHRVKQVDISEPTDINQSIFMNQFCPIEALIFIQSFFVFP